MQKTGFTTGRDIKMTNYFPMNDSLENKIGFYHIACFLVTLPFDRFFSHLVLISFLLHTIIHIRKKQLSSAWNWQTVLLTSVFLLSLIGISWSAYKSEGLKDLERQLAILLFPLAFQLSGLNLQRYRRSILHIFGVTCIITILYLFADAIRVIQYNRLPISSLFYSSFINHNFSAPIQLHATYLSMYISLSVASFVVFFLEEKNNKRSILYIISILILLAGLVQLASKSVLIATLLFTATGLLPMAWMTIKRTRFLILALFVSSIIILTITGFGAFQERYVNEFRDDLTKATLIHDNREPRIDRWRCALQIIGESPVIGHGSGSEKKLLKEKYYEKRMFNSYIKELNAHNQYLSICLKYGILGLVVFLIPLYLGFRRSIRNLDTVFFCFMVLIAIVSFSENILDVNKGIFFYGFFLSFFWLSGKPFAPFPRLPEGTGDIP